MKIFCAETLWDNEISSRRASYKSLLELVCTETGDEFAYFTFNTPEELDHLFEMFREKHYHVFYLASHMNNGDVVSGFKKKYHISIYEIIERNLENLKNRVLHLAGCSSLKNLKVEPGILKILSGYEVDTDSTESAVMDILYLVALSRGRKKDLDYLYKTYKCLIDVSGFKMYRKKESR